MKSKRKASIKSILIGDRAFYASVASIVVPIIIQNTVTQVVSLLDNVMVGRIGTLQMSAVAISNQLLMIFNLCIFGGLSGAGIFAAQFAGAHDEQGVRHCFRMKCYIALAAVAVAIGAFTIFPKELISLYMAEGESVPAVAATIGFGLDYMRVMLFGLFPFAAAQVYSSTLREVGETRMPMVASIAAILVNFVLNLLLIFGLLGFPRLGVVGAALATVISRYVEMGIIVVYTHIRARAFGFIRGAYASPRIPLDLLGSIMKKGMPLLANEFLWSSGIAMLLQCYSVRGLDVIAAANISQTLFSLFSVIFMSMGNAVAIMVGQELGAGAGKRATATVWKLISLAVVSSIVMGLLLVAASPVIPRMYNTEESVRSLAMRMLCVQAFIMPFQSFCHCCYFTLRAGGKTMITFFFDSVYTWGADVPVAFILANFTGMPIIPLYFCVQSLEIVKCILGYVLVRKGVWAQNIVGGAQAA